jgi:uncharacterized protein
MPLAVAAVSVPHAIATAVRLWRLRSDVDRQVLKSFGLMSAAGGLTGAILQRYATGPGLTIVFAALLSFVGVAQLTGLSERMRFGRRAGWIAGILSGTLGGLVGNQGGIRSAALLGYELSPAKFVATATAAGLIVDAARMPVYVVTERARLPPLVAIMVVASIGAVIGTLAGARLLKRIRGPLFRSTVGALILALGVYMGFRAWSELQSRDESPRSMRTSVSTVGAALGDSNCCEHERVCSASSAVKHGGLQRPRLQARKFHDARRVKSFREDHPIPERRRVFGNVTIGRKLPRLAQHV